MNLDRIRILLTVMITWACCTVQAQDFQFSQFYNVPLYQNPAFAGSLHQTRVSFHQRLQWPRLDSKYVTSAFSADTYFSNINSGVGVLIMRDQQGGSQISSTEAQFMYSYELRLNRTFTFRSGLQLGYVSRYIDYSQLHFPSQYNNTTGLYTNQNAYDTAGSGWKPQKAYGDVSAGGLLYSKRFWAGFAAHHLNTPNQSFAPANVNSTLPTEFAVTSGYQIYLYRKVSMHHEKQQVTITPTFHYKIQGKSNQLDLGVYGAYNEILLGVWYRGIPIFKQYQYDGIANNEALVLFIGWKGETLRIGYSYDYTISRLAQARTGGAHELNITYVFPKRHRKRIMRTLPCPSF